MWILLLMIFLYSFDGHLHYHKLNSSYANENHDHRKNINCTMVNSCHQFIQFLRIRFIHRHHLEMILHSNASKNKERFNDILPSWIRYKLLIKNKSTLSNWHITDLASVRLKLYQIIDNLWDKSRLLQAYSHSSNSVISPFFVMDYNSKYSHLIKLNSVAYVIEKY